MASFQAISSANDFGHRLDQLHGDNFDLQPSHDHQTNQQNNDLFFYPQISNLTDISLVGGKLKLTSKSKVRFLHANLAVIPYFTSTENFYPGQQRPLNTTKCSVKFTLQK